MHATGDGGVDVASNLMQNIQTLKAEVARLQSQLSIAQTERECCSYSSNNNNYCYYYGRVAVRWFLPECLQIGKLSQYITNTKVS